MDTFRAPVRDIRFLLEHVTPLSELAGLEDYAHADPELVWGLIDEAARFAEMVVAPTNRDGDREGARLVDGEVSVPASFVDAYRRFVDAGWGAVSMPQTLGGGGLPILVGNVVRELVSTANVAFALAPLLSSGAVHLLARHASEEQQRRYAIPLVSGAWSGTMNLTEPQAGSDVGAVRTRAVEHADGHHRVTGQKIFITYGDHDLTEQIVHLVLARLPEAPAGTAGLSLFIVPKLLVGPDGALGARNDVRVLSIEHKLGIHGAPTCVLAYGEAGEGAVGELIGPPHRGMRQMFTMMNDARLAVGLQGVAVAERAAQQARSFARDRLQGRRAGDPAEVQVPIVAHPDVRRMLLTQQAYIVAARALCYATAHAMDLATDRTDEDAARASAARADLLTPLAKAWATDLGVELASMALQVHGGMGYIEETGVAQHLRDARIAPIYEGTNGIQAIDLVTRKVQADDGVAVRALLDDVSRVADTQPATQRDALLRARVAVGEATDWILGDRPADDALAAATPYLRMLATLAAGGLIATGGAAASRRIDVGDHGVYNRSFLEAKVVQARFFVTQLLAEVHGLAPAVTAGASDVMEDWLPGD